MSLLLAENISEYQSTRKQAGPDGIVASGVLDASRIALLGHVAVYVLHERIRREDAMNKISAYILVVKVILEQRRDLVTGFVGSSA
jgi:hypothetical protein